MLTRISAKRPRLIALAALLSAVVVVGLALLFLPRTQSVAEPRKSPPGVTAQARSDICANPDQVRAPISEFIDGYDKGQADLADRYFAAAPDFQWYSEQPLHEGAPAYDRATFDAYLRQRHTDGDQLSVVTVEFNSVRGGIGNFGFVLDRSGTRLPSKGALDCASHKFIVWAIGPNAGPVP